MECLYGEGGCRSGMEGGVTGGIVSVDRGGMLCRNGGNADEKTDWFAVWSFTADWCNRL